MDTNNLSKVQLPPGTYGRIAPRSGLAAKHHIDVGAGEDFNDFFSFFSGVIDADFTGNMGVVLFNHGTETMLIDVGDRIAQLICERISYPRIQEVFDDSPTTGRGADGFGSSGDGIRKRKSVVGEKK